LVGSRSKIINNTCKPNTQRMSASQDARVHYAVPKQQPRTPQPHTRHETFSMRCQGQDQTKPNQPTTPQPAPPTTQSSRQHRLKTSQARWFRTQQCTKPTTTLVTTTRPVPTQPEGQTY
jgi:hypothetical protein